MWVTFSNLGSAGFPSYMCVIFIYDMSRHILNMINIADSSFNETMFTVSLIMKNTKFYVDNTSESFMALSRWNLFRIIRGTKSFYTMLNIYIIRLSIQYYYSNIKEAGEEGGAGLWKPEAEVFK